MSDLAATKKKIQPNGHFKFSSIDEYQASFPPGVQKILQQLRQAIKQAAPQATETISYNMPSFKKNKSLVYYAAYKEHIGFYPTPGPIKVFNGELTRFKTSKGGIQFPIDKPLPKGLIKKIVKFRVAEDLERSSKKETRSK